MIGDAKRASVRQVGYPVAGACLGVGVLAVVVGVTGAPVAWLILGACGVTGLAVLAWACLQRRFLEPLPLVAAFAVTSFGVRPLQLFIGHADLASWYPPPSTLDGLLQLENQEIARFVTTKLPGALEPALTRAVAACLVFLLAVIVGYALPLGRRLGRRAARLRAGTAPINLKAVVVGCVMLGLAGQVAIIAKTGGLAQVTEHLNDQKTLRASYVLYLFTGFGVMGLVIWLAWRRPATRRETVALTALVVESCAFFALAGSRTRALLLLVLLGIVLHYRWRPWRPREVAIGVVVLVLFSLSFLAVRQASVDRPFGRALLAAPKYLSDPRALLNDTTEFDQLFVAVNSIGSTLPYRHGGWLVDSVHAYVPSFIDPSRPPPADVVFRREIWGSSLGAGRPITAVGDFYYDFGWVGIVVGSLLLGIVARGAVGLVATDESDGRSYRVVLYATSLVILLEFVINGYGVAIDYATTLLLPFFVSVHLLGRMPSGRRRLGAPKAPVRSGA